MRRRPWLAVAIVWLTHAPELPAQSKPPLEISGHLNAAKVDAGSPVSFVVTITNTSSAPVANVRIPYVGGSQVELSRAWWCRDPAPRRSWANLGDCPVAARLAAGQSQAVFGTLRTSDAVVTAITAAVDWESPQFSRAVARLGSLEVEDPWTRSVQRFLAALPTLALPIGLAIIGGWLQWRLKKIELSRQDHAQKLADERNDREHLRSEQAQAWRLMLPISHDYTIKYYGDLESAAQEAAEMISEVRKTPTDKLSVGALDEALYQWLYVYVRIRILNESSAFYFKNQTGEVLVNALFKAFSLTFIYQCPPQGGASALSAEQQLHIRRLLNRVVESMDARATIDAVLARLESERSAGGGFYADLATWFHRRVLEPEIAQSLLYLRAFRAILSFEMNRPYVHWFERQVPLKLHHDLLVAVIDLCERLRSDEEMCDVAGELDAYLIQACIPEAAVRRARDEQATRP